MHKITIVKKQVLYVVTFSLFGCNSVERVDDLQIGKKLPSDIRVINDSNIHIFKGASNGRPGKEIECNGIKYLVIESKDSTVDFLRTFDTSFRTPENAKVGSSYDLIKNRKMSEFYESGYGYGVKLNSGWTALFMDKYILENETIADTCRIKSFFMESAGQ